MRVIKILLLTLLVVSCARLEITTSVYSGDIPIPASKAYEFITSTKNDEVYANISKSKNPLNWLLKSSKSIIIEGNTETFINNKLTEKKARISAHKIWDTLENEIASQFEEDIIQLEDSILRTKVAVAKLENSLINKKYVKRELLFHASRSEYLSAINEKTIFDHNYTNLTCELARLFTGKGSIADKEAAEEISKLKSINFNPGIAGNERFNGQTVGSPLFSNSIRYLPKDDKYWSTYSRTKFSAYGGDAQFVAVRKGLVDFRQKSLDFDPTSTIAAGSALTKASLKVAAALATGQIPSLTGTEKQENTDVVWVDEAQFKSDKETLKRRTRATQIYLGELAEIYDKSNMTLPPTLAELANEVERITTKFEAFLLLPTKKESMQ
jgi:hypothetical protein